MGVNILMPFFLLLIFFIFPGRIYIFRCGHAISVQKAAARRKRKEEEKEEGGKNCFQDDRIQGEAPPIDTESPRAANEVDYSENWKAAKGMYLSHKNTSKIRGQRYNCYKRQRKRFSNFVSGSEMA